MVTGQAQKSPKQSRLLPKRANDLQTTLQLYLFYFFVSALLGCVVTKSNRNRGQWIFNPLCRIFRTKTTLFLSLSQFLPFLTLNNPASCHVLACLARTKKHLVNI